MLEVRNLTIYKDDHCLIDKLSFILNENDKCAVIGEEGNGKSTLLKAIIGIEDYYETSGEINTNQLRIGYLPQSLDIREDKSVTDYLFDSEEQYYDSLVLLHRKMKEFQLDDSFLSKPVRVLSGGEKVKLGLLKLMLKEYDILLLDEPTNDIDLKTLHWMETFIQNETRPILFVSHDETLLSRTANCIIHIERIKKKSETRNTFVHMDYDSYISQRLHLIERQSQMAVSDRREYRKSQEKLNRIMQKVEHRQSTISRGDPHGGRLLKKKMKNLKAQERKLDDVQLTEKPDVEEGINLFFDDIRIPNGKVILEFKDRCITVDDQCLLQDVNIKIIGNTHLCFIGNNGSGKTTLMKEIYNELKDREDIHVGYMPQNYQDILKDDDSVLDFLCPRGDKESITKARLCLGNLKFTRDEMTGKIADLSNGSKAKLFFLKLILDRNDVLLLDEPTRNVSPLSNPVIRKALKEYGGCIISVSHDRKYLSEVIDEIYLIEDGRCQKAVKEMYIY